MQTENLLRFTHNWLSNLADVMDKDHTCNNNYTGAVEWFRDTVEMIIDNLN